jgi:hypothetical protein
MKQQKPAHLHWHHRHSCRLAAGLGRLRHLRSRQNDGREGEQIPGVFGLRHMSAAERLKALKALAEKINAMSPEERQRWRLNFDWFRQLTEEEKAFFLDAFLPGEMKTALAMFEKWPKERQQHEIDQAMTELRKHAANPRANPISGINGTNGPIFSPELDKKIRTIGLNSLYSQGSAATKAELAPLLLEVQRQFESGQLNLSHF